MNYIFMNKPLKQDDILYNGAQECRVKNLINQFLVQQKALIILEIKIGKEFTYDIEIPFSQLEFFGFRWFPYERKEIEIPLPKNLTFLQCATWISKNGWNKYEGYIPDNRPDDPGFYMKLQDDSTTYIWINDLTEREMSQPIWNIRKRQ